MSPHQLLLGCVLILTCMVATIESLQCFQCASTQNNGGDCLNDLNGLINASLGLGKETVRKYVKNCTDSNPVWTRCMIQQAQSNGLLTLYHRGCHDGVTFSLEFDSPRFRNLSANNFTTCDQIGVTGKVACYTFCDTDFCNGPQVPREDPVCREYYDNPYDVTLPENYTCGADILFSGNGPIPLQFLCLVTFCVLLIGLLRSE